MTSLNRKPAPSTGNAGVRRGLISPIGTVAWAYVGEPRLNLSEKLEWSMGLVLTEAELSTIAEIIDEVANEYRAANPSFPDEQGLNFPFTESREPKQADGSKGAIIPGMWLFKLKRGAEGRDRTGAVKRQTPPIICDSQGRPVKDIEIGAESRVRVSYDLYAYDKAGQKGVGAGLKAVQIVELVAPGGVSFDAVEGGTFRAEEEGLTDLF